ncbi:TPA: aldehyde dehydrogenase family protein [Legionella pneumophila]|uniref:aldehyde dehydrogenase family protein n=1 Tax=Legionella pneumophila TaxID=446 RepID=UPI00078811DA|nr:aldehyde dehydrogenase family protein [Legionella pneumophila]HAT1658536.1 aldehyde dehydrogenase family protein [Legionella pneumophila]HAT6937408.1 aldehyde dehydrogenase family protein [Legionella pneumophila]HAT8124058.1 aldehyde dehydrogenase family protein [Legionella pneumophila]HAU1193184.1 aldehyde dehydrogenase family protein [Legionella pneumophila]HAU1653324.1 aldehyde dehydrogenase family protein [Legionella pneumophila]
MEIYEMYIDGKFTLAKSGATRDIIDPANGELIAKVPESTKEDAICAIKAARKAFDEGEWRKSLALDRGKLLFKLADLIRANAKRLAELETRNCGKPLPEAEFDVTDAANCFEFYGGLATKIHGETMSVPANSFSYVVREPIGVCGQIIPWNFPLLMAAWKLAPALAAGNTAVLKPSELTPITALELFKLIDQCGFPAGVVNLVTGPGIGVGEELASNPLVDKLAFTGGSATGRKIMQAATGNLKKISLELGGKNPNIVFADCDLEMAIDGALFGAFANQGEVCSAGSRLIVERSIHKKIVEGMLKKIPNIKIGHGLDAGVKMGPLVSSAHLEKVESYIKIGMEEGAKLLCGGKRPTGREFAKGNFFEPTIFDEVKPAMRIAREEIFGPVLVVIPFDTEEEAIRIANDTDYGLSGAVWTKSVTRAHRVTSQIRAGILWVNHYHPTYNEMPWGGYKQSGAGRELGLYGIESYLEVKQVNINLDETPIGWY